MRNRSSARWIISGAVLLICIVYWFVQTDKMETQKKWLSITVDLYTAEQITIEGYSEEPIIIQDPNKVEEFKNYVLPPERVHKFKRDIEKHIDSSSFTISFLLPDSTIMMVETFKLSRSDTRGFSIDDSYFIAKIENQYCNIFLGVDASEILP